MPADQAERRDVILSCSGSMQTYHRAVAAAGRINRTLSTSSEFDVYPDFLSLLSAVLLVNGRTNQQYCVKAAIVQSRYNTSASRFDRLQLV